MALSDTQRASLETEQQMIYHELRLIKATQKTLEDRLAQINRLFGRRC